MSRADGKPASVLTDPRNIWVFHRGALGDSVLLWPRLRHWSRAGSRVTLVTDAAKAALAQRELGIVGVDAEQRRYNDLWRAGAAVEPVAGAGLVVDHISSPDSTAFRANLRRMFPDAELVHGPPPRGGQNGAAWVADHPAAQVERRPNPGGPIVLHVGAGSIAKRWPIQHWQALSLALASRAQVQVIAGEVEREQFAAESRRLFSDMGGRYLDELSELADCLRAARLVVGCDSGPAHLAAQLGIATLALFGPTDPVLWAPVGPSVRVLTPPMPWTIEWLEVRRVTEVAVEMLGSA